MRRPPVTIEYAQKMLGTADKPKSRWWVYQQIKIGKLTPVGLSVRPILLDPDEIDKLALLPRQALSSGVKKSRCLKTEKKKQITSRSSYQTRKENLWR